MQKSIFTLEYPLKSASPIFLWNKIGSPLGLSEWFADEVFSSDSTYIFKWEEFQQSARLLELKPFKSIRFQWLDDLDTPAYFEFRIDTQELTGEVTLVITDFAWEDEKEDAILLWNYQVDKLKRIGGM